MNANTTEKELIVIPPAIATERLRLQKHSVRQGFGVNQGRPLARIIYDVVDGDRTRLREYLFWVDLIRSEKDQDAYLVRCEEAWRAFEMFDFGIYLPTGELIGNCGVHTVSRTARRGEIGYWILGEYENQGYVTEAVAALVRGCFAAGMHRLEIRCNAENRKSYGVAERLSFQLEGLLREDCIENGEWRSTRIYGALATDSAWEVKRV